MADKEKEQIRILTKLLRELRELQAKTYEIGEEMNRILEGKAGIGSQLRELETAFDAAWGMRYAGGATGQYVWNRSRDVPMAKRLLKALTLEELTARAVRYVRSEDPFYGRARHPFNLFVQSINTHADSGADLQLEAEAPGDCKHRPRCKTDAQHTRARSTELRA